jgi:hypothetical protein
MKKVITLSTIVIIGVLFLSTAGFAGKVKTKHGYWNFEGDVQIKGSDVMIVVRNRSTDDSYGSKKCKNGMASCVVDVELWHSDAGNLGSNRISFQDVCNGSGARKVAISNVPRKYKRLEVRFNVTTPNGGHSFHKGRFKWNR